jgi:pimeloyl-ACP methyl ester carboxylesterase
MSGVDYILLHGTAQSTAGWERLAGALAGRGHRALPVDFPVDRPGLLAADYAGIAADQVGGVAERPVVVAHSGAGLLLPAVADRLGAGHLVWLAAAVPDFDGGSSFAEQIERSGSELAGEEWRRFGRESTEDPVVAAYFGFHDCDLETLRWALTTVQLFYPAAVYAERPPARPEGPSTYVLPRQDRTLRPEWMSKVARDRLGVEPVEIDGGHFPHVSRPDVLADILEGCRGTNGTFVR